MSTAKAPAAPSDRICEKLLKMMSINNYCTDFMFQEVMVCVTCSPSILSLIIFNFLLVFKISQKFVEFYVYRF